MVGPPSTAVAAATPRCWPSLCTGRTGWMASSRTRDSRSKSACRQRLRKSVWGGFQAPFVLPWLTGCSEALLKQRQSGPGSTVGVKSARFLKEDLKSQLFGRPFGRAQQPVQMHALVLVAVLREHAVGVEQEVRARRVRIPEVLRREGLQGITRLSFLYYKG